MPRIIGDAFKFLLMPIMLLATSGSIQASELKINIAQLPIFAESKESGLIIDLIKYLDKTTPDTKISYNIAPFSRSVESLKNGVADLHMPIIEASENFPLAQSDFTLFNVQFSIFSLAEDPISIETFENIIDIPYLAIETDAAHTDLFKRKLKPTHCLDCSVKKLAIKRIQGLIYAAPIIRSIIRKEGITSIVETPYMTYPVKFAFNHSEQGHAAATRLESILRSRRDDPKFIEIMNKLNFQHEAE